MHVFAEMVHGALPFFTSTVQNVNWNSRTGKASSSAKSAGDKILKEVIAG